MLRNLYLRGAGAGAWRAPVPTLPRLRLAQWRSLFIQTASTPNEDALKFIPSQNVLGAGARSVEFLSGREAHSSPLARKLFAIDGVRGVLFGSDFVTVEKDADARWALVKPEVFSVLTEHFSSGKPVLVKGTVASADTLPSEGDSEVVSMIKELIDTRIRPAIQEDGGDIEFVRFTDAGVVQLSLRGACRSCDSSTITLKHGIESMLMHYIEEVKGVEQVLSDDEQRGLDEFNKLEQQLQSRSKDADAARSL